MNRADVYRAHHGISLKQKVGTAQNLFLSGVQNRLAAPGGFTQTAESQRPCLLQALTIDAKSATGEPATGEITEVTVAGQSCFVSDKSCSIQAFSPEAFNASCRSLGISVNNNMKVVVQGNLTNAGGNVSLAIALEPITEDQVKTRAEQAEAYNYVFGCGTATIAAAGKASLTARSNRAVTLGELIIANETAPGGAFVVNSDIVVTSILIGGLEMLNGATGAQEISLNCFQSIASDYQGLNFGYPIAPQTEVEIKFENKDAVNAATVSGAIFCEPWTAK